MKMGPKGINFKILWDGDYSGVFYTNDPVDETKNVYATLSQARYEVLGFLRARRRSTLAHIKFVESLRLSTVELAPGEEFPGTNPPSGDTHGEGKEVQEVRI